MAIPLPDTIQAPISGIVDAPAGEFTIRWLGTVMFARAMFVDVVTYEVGDQVFASRVGSSTEWMIFGKITAQDTS